MARINFIQFLFLMLILSCSGPNETVQKDFLSPSFIISNQDSTLTSYMFDKGSWFGITLPDEGFGIAPPRMLSDSNGYNFRADLLRGVVKENGNPVTDIANQFLPGSLIQQAYTEKSKIVKKVIFADHQNLLIAYTIKNLSEEAVEYQVEWNYPLADIRAKNEVVYDLGNALLSIDFLSKVKVPDEKFSKELKLKKDVEVSFFINVKHRFKTEESIDLKYAELPAAFEDNNRRWTEYLAPYQSLSLEKRMLASKCIQTLINNWRVPAGELAWEGLFPSYDYKWFHGFWSWDSWKHAVALVSFEPELAKNQIRTMYHFQDEYGMIADVVYRDTLIENHNWRDTKPPLSGWAIREVFDATGDTAFVRELLPNLLRYHNWWYENRDNNGNGFCEYGSTDGTLTAAGWESGMDNAVRFDDAKIMQVNESAWSINQESVDLNAYLLNEKQHIAYLIGMVEGPEKTEPWTAAATELDKRIKERFYNKATGYFHDVGIPSGTFISHIGPEAWTALWTGVATQEQADALVKKITSPDHFNTFVPFPTLSSSNAKFNPEKGYWRGPVWLDQAYFALKGMEKYGYAKEAEQLREKLYANAEGLLEKGMPIRENYHPVTGAGLNARHFSWSAAHLLMLLADEAAGQSGAD